jgi:hypothetical protein
MAGGFFISRGLIEQIFGVIEQIPRLAQCN